MICTLKSDFDGATHLRFFFYFTWWNPAFSLVATLKKFRLNSTLFFQGCKSSHLFKTKNRVHIKGASDKICVDITTTKKQPKHLEYVLKKHPFVVSVVLAYHHRVKMSENALCYTRDKVNSILRLQATVYLPYLYKCKNFW